MKPPPSGAEHTGDESWKGRDRTGQETQRHRSSWRDISPLPKKSFKNVTQAVGLCWDAAQDLVRSPSVQMLSYPCMGKGKGRI